MAYYSAFSGNCVYIGVADRTDASCSRTINAAELVEATVLNYGQRRRSDRY